MKIQREALLKEFGYKPSPNLSESHIDDLKRKLNLLEQENHHLRKKLSDTDLEKNEFFNKSKQAITDVAAKDRTITELQNSVARLRNQIWNIENSKAPIQVFAFTMFILVLVLLLI